MRLWKKPSSRGRRRGAGAFTLIEMLVVLALGAVMATIVVVGLGGSYRAARLEDVAGRVANYDRLTREYARRFGRAEQLVFDLGAGTIGRGPADDGETSDPRENGVLHLPAGMIVRVVTAAEGAVSGGRAAVNCSTDGQTPTYAVCLKGVKGDEYWMLTVGLTGQTLRMKDEREVQDIFRLLADGRNGPVALATPARDDAR